ncbi:hypothetical protein RB653_000973 [Dictyostelium firmibasis]|uniref:GPR180/TMEM145 transmembrane domain-containing protein n=1 Tax=Dictyostelium firmibasis TaxID=79012 RepID=A0AAN7U477_9MYCE
MNRVKLFLILSLAILISKVSSTRLRGEIFAPQPFTKYIGKFCFNNGGNIIVDINWDYINIDTAKLLLFSDTIDNVIEKVESLSCYSKVTPSYEFNRYSNLSKVYQVKGQRDRYWYLVIQNCEKFPSKLQYDISLSNEGDQFDRFLSADQQSVPQVHTFYFILGLILILISIIWIAQYFRRNNLNGWVIESLVMIMTLSLVSIFLYTFNWVYVIYNIPPGNRYYEISNWLYIFSKNLFYLLLIYAGQGWTTSIYYNSMIRNCVNLFFIIFNIALGWSLSFIYNYQKPDIRAYNYYLDTLPGYFSYVAYGILTIYFIVCNVISYRSLNDAEPLRKTYLKIFTFVFSIYMLSPILVGIISHFVVEYMKFKVSTIMNHTFDFIFYIVLMVFFRPTAGNVLVNKLVNSCGIELKEFKNNPSNI